MSELCHLAASGQVMQIPVLENVLKVDRLFDVPLSSVP